MTDGAVLRFASPVPLWLKEWQPKLQMGRLGEIDHMAEAYVQRRQAILIEFGYLHRYVSSPTTLAKSHLYVCMYVQHVERKIGGRVVELTEGVLRSAVHSAILFLGSLADYRVVIEGTL